MTRKFALVAGAIVLVAAGVLAIVQYDLFQRQVGNLAGRDHMKLTRVVANDLWELAEGVFRLDLHPTDPAYRATPEYKALDARARLMTVGTNVMKIKIMDGRGIVRYSTAPGDLGKNIGYEHGFAAAMAERPAGEYGLRDEFMSVSGPQQNVWIASSFVPGLEEGVGRPRGVLELSSDITSRRGAIRDAAINNITVSAIVLAAVYVLLLLVIFAAVRMVRVQYQRAVALAGAVARVEAASQAKTAFLANMSHELRTPLNAIIGFSEIMGSELKGPLGDASYKSYVSDISRSGRHLLEMIDKVLDLVRAESGSIPLDVAPTNAAFVAKSVARMVSKDAEAGGLTLAVKADEDPITIDTDSAKLREILLGILSNSIKFTPAGGTIKVKVARGDNGSGARLTVTDTGIGMRPEDVPAASAPFGHIESVYAKSRGGVGLGLPLARKLTELLEGSFAITSSQGKGTTVVIELPQRTATVPANDAGKPAHNASAG